MTINQKDNDLETVMSLDSDQDEDLCNQDLSDSIIDSDALKMNYSKQDNFLPLNSFEL